MRFFPAAADPTALDRAAAYAADGPVTALTAEKIREELDAEQFRPEWIWLAEDDDGQVLARALWWGRADSERPLALDCLQVRSTVADPVAVATGLLDTAHAALGTRPLYNLCLPADWRTRPELTEAVAWRREAGARTGLTREIERLRYEWTPAAGLPLSGGRLTFREGSDEEFLEAFVQVSAGSLDQATREELRRKDARRLAEEDLRFYLDCPGERSWWRLAELPDGTLAGLAVPSATPYSRNVGYLGVVPEQRGKGLIDEILAEITRFQASEGAERVTATTDTANVPMAAAFDRAGYEVTEIRVVLETPRAA
ncbi:N-acetyltransferase [Streptomyces violarus]|uniref:RimJ/RimL family protein N-acetyltransferase n=1 Tax=Streptomyces violarus TaxID=67380 RepID=A0A7W4ZSN4_9ACTN|nr:MULTISPECIES: GNAT family N-acetyltransferase [Streptomyces]MBB3077990.1 RimJ/RimL family protein N-acetyltransferase [Streptomyces violarus]WRT99843.1 GNAT family N-acetyltransferase [Streptomyces sp. CGMCC 4.1772]GHD19197.1 N-acetyltransferase [Streptomyces violarus]